MNNAIIKCLFFWVLFTAFLSGSGFLAGLAPPDWFVWVRIGQAILVILFSIYLIRIFLKSEKRTFTDIGLKWDKGTLYRFLLGILVGTAIFTVVLLVLVTLTGFELKRSANDVNWQAWLASLLVIIPFAYLEELAFRSYTLLKLDNAYGLFWAQFLVAISFALYHVAGGWSWQVAFLGPGAWAFVFGLAAIMSRGIALPTGIHAALNFLQVLVGMKPGKASFWRLELKQNIPDASMLANRVGIGIQISILIVGIVATFLFIQWKKMSLNKVPVTNK